MRINHYVRRACKKEFSCSPVSVISVALSSENKVACCRRHCPLCRCVSTMSHPMHRERRIVRAPATSTSTSTGTRPCTNTKPCTDTRPCTGTRPCTDTRPCTGTRPCRDTRPSKGARCLPSCYSLPSDATATTGPCPLLCRCHRDALFALLIRAYSIHLYVCLLHFSISFLSIIPAFLFLFTLFC